MVTIAEQSILATLNINSSSYVSCKNCLGLSCVTDHLPVQKTSYILYQYVNDHLANLGTFSSKTSKLWYDTDHGKKLDRYVLLHRTFLVQCLLIMDQRWIEMLDKYKHNLLFS